MTDEQKAKIPTVCQEAELTFWAVVAKSYPEVTTGDYDPLETVKESLADEDRIRQWLDWNA